MGIDAEGAGQIVELALAAGFDAAGIARVPDPGSAEDFAELAGLEAWIEAGRAGEMEYLKRRDEVGRLLRSSARIAYPWARSVLVCAVNYNSAAPYSTESNEPDKGWIARYAWSGSDGTATDYHSVILERLRLLEGQIKASPGGSPGGEFQSRCLVDTGPLVERVYARYAGVGWVGKNTCILNQGLGSWLFLGVIVMSLELDEAQPAQIADDRCGSCTRCIEACPTDALTAPYQMDASKCISYLTIEKRGAIGDEHRAEIGRQVFGCDICQDVCPWNRKAPIGGWSEFQPRKELVNPSLDWLAGLDRSAWKRLFRGSPVERTRYAGFRRNVAIAMGNSGEVKFAAQLDAWKQDEDAVLRETAAWALAQIGRGSADSEAGKAATRKGWNRTGLERR